jgi:hypothetical protein
MFAFAFDRQSRSERQRKVDVGKKKKWRCGATWDKADPEGSLTMGKRPFSVFQHLHKQLFPSTNKENARHGSRQYRKILYNVITGTISVAFVLFTSIKCSNGRDIRKEKSCPWELFVLPWEEYAFDSTHGKNLVFSPSPTYILLACPSF